MGIKRNPRQGDSRLIRILLAVGAATTLFRWLGGETNFFSVEILNGFNFVCFLGQSFFFHSLFIILHKLSYGKRIFSHNMYKRTVFMYFFVVCFAFEIHFNTPKNCLVVFVIFILETFMLL